MVDVELELVRLVLLLELVVLLVDDVVLLEVDVLVLLVVELVREDVLDCPVVLLDVVVEGPVVEVVEDGDVVLDDETLGWLTSRTATVLTDATTIMARIA